METLWTKFSSEGSADSWHGEATSKIKLDLLSLKIRILHCLKEGGIQKWKTAHRCLAVRERENYSPPPITPERTFYVGNIYTIS